MSARGMSYFIFMTLIYKSENINSTFVKTCLIHQIHTTGTRVCPLCPRIGVLGHINGASAISKPRVFNGAAYGGYIGLFSVFDGADASVGG